MHKKKINVIKPTLRHKKRYVLISYTNDLQVVTLNLFTNNFKINYGLFTLIKANIKLINLDLSNKTILFRVNKNYLDDFLASFFFLNKDLGFICVKCIKSTLKGIENHKK